MSNNLPRGFYKTTPESFVVQEVIKSIPPRPPWPVEFSKQSIVLGWKGDPYTIFTLSKSGWSAEKAMREVARQLDVSFADISAHGLKDKQACTSQHIGVRGNFCPYFSHQDMSLVQLHGQNSPLFIGDIEGNRFDITILSQAESIDETAIVAVPNLFGPQRLGKHEGSEQVGRLFLEGRPEEAIEQILTIPPAADKFLEVQELTGGSWEEVLSHPEYQFSFKFEIQKWQSYLWNKFVQEQMEKLGSNTPNMLPLWNPSKRIFEMYKHLWNPSQLNQKVLKFINEKDRPTMLRPKYFRAKRTIGGWNFKFDLPPGAYATVVLEKLFRLEERRV